MPKYTILSRVDAYVDYVTEIEADTPRDAVAIAEWGRDLEWEMRGVVEFDARHMVALDENGEEIESTARGKG